MSRDKITVVDLLARKLDGPKIAAITAYDATFARLFDAAGVDILLVGDSLGMAIQGNRTTLPVTIEEICYHARAVARTEPRAHVCGDLPFLSYQSSIEQAVISAGRLLKEGGCESVKLEGGSVYADRIRAIVAAGIPVMGHLGLTPQSVHAFGGFRVQARDDASQRRLIEDAAALVEAGVFAIVLEGIPSDVARRVTESVTVPTIGIGAGPHCSGQVLVCYDMLGLDLDFRPKFVRRYAELGERTISSTLSYIEDVRSGAFPAAEHCYREQTKSRQPMPTLPEGSLSSLERSTRDPSGRDVDNGKH